MVNVQLLGGAHAQHSTLNAYKTTKTMVKWYEGNNKDAVKTES